MKKSHALAFIPFLMASAALAEPATENGAKHLTQVFQTYLGATKGVVSVVANGAVYDLTLDVAPLMALAKDSGTSGSVTPLKMVLTDNGNGTWGVTQDQAVSVALTLPDGSDMKEDFASIKSEGTFDEALMTFSSLKGEFSGIKMTSTSKTPEGAVTAEMSLDKGTIDGHMTIERSSKKSVLSL